MAGLVGGRLVAINRRGRGRYVVRRCGALPVKKVRFQDPIENRPSAQFFRLNLTEGRQAGSLQNDLPHPRRVDCVHNELVLNSPEEVSGERLQRRCQEVLEGSRQRREWAHHNGGDRARSSRGSDEVTHTQSCICAKKKDPFLSAFHS